MPKQTWTAAVSAALFVVLAAVIALTPVPFVTYGPGSTYDLLGSHDGQDVISVSGVPSHPVNGEIRLTTATVTPADGTVALPEALFAWWSPAHEILPRWSVYPAGASPDGLKARDAELMDTSRQDATALGLQAAGIAVTPMPVVLSVTDTGPAAGRLEPGDLIMLVDDQPTPNEAAVRQLIGTRAVGDPVVFTVLRDREQRLVRVATVASKNQSAIPVVGVRLGMGYKYEPTVSINVDRGIGGSSAGLMMALAVYDKVSPKDLARGRVVAGTGQIGGDGVVAEVGGIREKVVGARVAGAEVFLLPEANCVDVPPDPGMRVVPVNSLGEAVQALEALATPGQESSVRGCP